MDLDEFEEFEREGEEEEIQSTYRSIFKWAIGLLTMATLSWVGWVSLNIIQTSTSIETIKKLQESIDALVQIHHNDIDAMWKEFRNMDTRLNDMPPRDFRNRVDSMERKLDTMSNEFKQNAVEHTQILGTIGKIELNQQISIENLKEIKAAIIKDGVPK